MTRWILSPVPPGDSDERVIAMIFTLIAVAYLVFVRAMSI